jgi:hypothetical protein
MNLLTIASLLLALGAVVAWVRSYIVMDSIVVSLVYGDSVWRLDSVRGQVNLYWDIIHPAGQQTYLRCDWYHVPLRDVPERSSLPPFSYRRTSEWAVVAVPWWSFMLAGILLPGLRLWRDAAARRRVSRGLCRRCGYDLRASGDRCPECGTVVAASRSLRAAANGQRLA